MSMDTELNSTELASVRSRFAQDLNVLESQVSVVSEAMKSFQLTVTVTGLGPAQASTISSQVDELSEVQATIAAAMAAIGGPTVTVTSAPTVVMVQATPTPTPISSAEESPGGGTGTGDDSTVVAVSVSITLMALICLAVYIKKRRRENDRASKMSLDRSSLDSVPNLQNPESLTTQNMIERMKLEYKFIKQKGSSMTLNERKHAKKIKTEIKKLRGDQVNFKKDQMRVQVGEAIDAMANSEHDSDSSKSGRQPEPEKTTMVRFRELSKLQQVRRLTAAEKAEMKELQSDVEEIKERRFSNTAEISVDRLKKLKKEYKKMKVMRDGGSTFNEQEKARFTSLKKEITLMKELLASAERL